MTGPNPARRIYWYCRLSGAVSRYIDARQVAVPGTHAAVVAADLRTSLDDLRAAHTLASLAHLGVMADDLRPDGILTVEATLRTRHAEGRCLTCGRAPVGHGGDCEGLDPQVVAAFVAESGDGGLFPLPVRSAA